MNAQTFTSAGQDIQLVLSKMENTFYDPNTLCVNFTVDYTGIVAGTSGTNGSYILGYAYSHFSRQVVRPISGQPIEYLVLLLKRFENSLVLFYIPFFLMDTLI